MCTYMYTYRCTINHVKLIDAFQYFNSSMLAWHCHTIMRIYVVVYKILKKLHGDVSRKVVIFRIGKYIYWSEMKSPKPRDQLDPQWNHEDFSILIWDLDTRSQRNIHCYTFQSSFPVFKIGTLVVWPAVDLFANRHTLLNWTDLSIFRLNLFNLDRFG